MATKKDASRYTIKFDPTIPSHIEAMRTLDEAGRGKAALIADAIRIRNALYSCNADVVAALLPNISRHPAPVQLQSEQVAVAAALPQKSKTQNTSGAIKSEDDFWEGMDDVLKLFSM